MQFLNLYQGEKELILNEMMMRSGLFQTKGLVGFEYCQLIGNKNYGLICRSTRTHYPDSEPTSLCSFSLMMHALREETNTNIIVIGLTRWRLEPAIYHPGEEHANCYTIDAIQLVLMSIMVDNNENSPHCRDSHATNERLRISQAHNVPCY